MERKTILIEHEDGSIEIQGPPDLIQKAMEAERRTASKKEGIFSGMGNVGLGTGKPKLPEMGGNMLGKVKSGLPESNMPGMELDIGKMRKPAAFEGPSLGNIGKPSKGFGDISGKGRSMPEMPEPKLPDGFTLKMGKKKKD